MTQQIKMVLRKINTFFYVVNDTYEKIVNCRYYSRKLLYKISSAISSWHNNISTKAYCYKLRTNRTTIYSLLCACKIESVFP